MSASAAIMPPDSHFKNTARAQARDILGGSTAFWAMPPTEQKAIYLSLVNDLIDKQRDKYGLSKPMATDSGADMGYKGYDPAFKADTKAFTELVQSVNFPQFVGDLLRSVFDANLRVMKQQTDAYIKLMKEATKSASEFIVKVKDDETFGRLAENKSNKYNVSTEKGPDGANKLTLTTPEGDKHDLEDAEVKRDILEEKINMAKEHRAALREVLLMGVTRLVVEKGQIEAGVDFSIKATRASTAHHEDQNINVATVSTSIDSPLGGLFGGPSASLEDTNTNIQVNTSDKKTTDDLSATLHGKVNIQFKTDYFKLDNFANMYADGGTAALKPPAPGQAPPALPAR
jgi:hypothetical protein